MIKKTLLFVILSGCAATAFAQSFPLWEHILKHHSGKTDDCSSSGRAVQAPAFARQRRVRGATLTRLPESSSMTPSNEGAAPPNALQGGPAGVRHEVPNIPLRLPVASDMTIHPT
jgi:hypothetical protein